jgi:hypothetical protein
VGFRSQLELSRIKELHQVVEIDIDISKRISKLLKIAFHRN